MIENIRRHLFEAALLLTLCSIVMGGCATVGHEFPVESVAKIENGHTTQAEILEMFGEPWRTGIEDGQKTWTYARYRYRLFGKVSTTDLIVRFNSSNLVESYSYNTTEAENER